jgi:hypothetical protein
MALPMKSDIDDRDHNRLADSYGCRDQAIASNGVIDKQ